MTSVSSIRLITLTPDRPDTPVSVSKVAPSPPPNTPIAVELFKKTPTYFSWKNTTITQTTTIITPVMDVKDEEAASNACCIIC